MIKTYYLTNSLGYITIPESLNKDNKITLDHLGRSAIFESEEKFLVIKAFLCNTKEESEVKARNWFNENNLNINDLENWYYRDISSYAKMFKTYELLNYE